MEIYALIPIVAGLSSQIEDALYAWRSDQYLEIITSVFLLEYRLKTAPAETSLLVLYVDGKKMLSSLLAIKQRLCGRQIVVVLAKHDEEMLAICNRLCPAAVVYAHRAAEKLPTVLDEMMGLLQTERMAQISKSSGAVATI